jgi:hypothetical protein
MGMIAIQEEDGTSSTGSDQAVHLRALPAPLSAARRHGTISFSPFSRRLQGGTQASSPTVVDVELGVFPKSTLQRSGSVGLDSRRQENPPSSVQEEQAFADRVSRVNEAVTVPQGSSSNSVLGGIRKFLLSAGGEDSDGGDDTAQWEGAGREDSSDSGVDSPTEVLGAVELSAVGGDEDDDEEEDGGSSAAPVSIVNPVALNEASPGLNGVGKASGLTRGDRAKRLAATTAGVHNGGQKVALPSVSTTAPESAFSEETHSQLQECVHRGRPNFEAVLEGVLKRIWEDEKRRHAALHTLSAQGVLPAALLHEAEQSDTREVRIGVFFCGPRPMGQSLKDACAKVSRDFVPLAPVSNGLPKLSVRTDFHKESFW